MFHAPTLPPAPDATTDPAAVDAAHVLGAIRNANMRGRLYTTPKSFAAICAVHLLEQAGRAEWVPGEGGALGGWFAHPDGPGGSDDFDGTGRPVILA